MSGPCAKKRVVATLRSLDGSVFIGENKCANPQRVCPRVPGEGYEKCKSICAQRCHAEIDALEQAGEKSKGSTVHVTYNRCCGDCLRAMNSAGVAIVTCEG